MNLPSDNTVRKLGKSVHETEERVAAIPLPLSRRLSLGTLVKETMRRTKEHHVLAFAGNLTYNAFLAIFPFLLFLVSVLKAFQATSLVTKLLDEMSRSLPSAASHSIRHLIVPEVMSRLTTNPILSIFLALGSLWAASAVARAAMQAMDIMYGVTDTRPLWRKLLSSIVLSLAIAALFLAALILLVLGGSIATRIDSYLGSGSALSWLWSIGHWPLLVALAVVAFALAYSYAPDTSPSWRGLVPGTVVATVAWLIFSGGFALVLDNFAGNLIAPLYGWFTGLIILLMYMYWSSVILLVGAEINQVVGSAPHRRA